MPTLIPQSRIPNPDPPLAYFLQNKSTEEKDLPFHHFFRVQLPIFKLMSDWQNTVWLEPMITKDERRTHPRTAVDWPAMIVTQEACIGGETRNISQTGAFIHCLTEPENGKQLRLVFRDPLRHKWVLVAAELAWSNISSCDDIGSCGIGVRFKRVFDHDHLFLNSVTADHLQTSV